MSARLNFEGCKGTAQSLIFGYCIFVNKVVFYKQLILILAPGRTHIFNLILTLIY